MVMYRLDRFLRSRMDLRSPGVTQDDANMLSILKYELDHHKLVPIASCASILAVQKWIPAMQKMTTLNNCYGNARAFKKLLESERALKIKYVKGYLYGAVPLLHAFNKVNEKYVDITLEFAVQTLDPTPASETHYSVIELTAQELVDCVQKYGGITEDIQTRYIMDRCNIHLNA
jgi:hypothetical protein